MTGISLNLLVHSRRSCKKAHKQNVILHWEIHDKLLRCNMSRTPGTLLFITCAMCLAHVCLLFFILWRLRCIYWYTMELSFSYAISFSLSSSIFSTNLKSVWQVQLPMQLQEDAIRNSSSAVMTGIWWRAIRSATINHQTFSVCERSGESVGQGSSRIFCIKEILNKTANMWSCIILLKRRVSHGSNKR